MLAIVATHFPTAGASLPRISQDALSLYATRRRLYESLGTMNRGLAVYDEQIFDGVGTFAIPNISTMLKLLSIQSRDELHTFELGCGEGRVILELKAAYPDADIVGMNSLGWQAGARAHDSGAINSDKPQKLLEAAAYYNISARPGNLPRVILGDAAKGLPVPNGSLDMFYSFNAFHYVEPTKRLQVVQEVVRKLKPNGVAFFAYNSIPWTNASTGRYLLKDLPLGKPFILQGMRGHLYGGPISACVFVASNPANVNLSKAVHGRGYNSSDQQYQPASTSNSNLLRILIVRGHVLDGLVPPEYFKVATHWEALKPQLKLCNKLTARKPGWCTLEPILDWFTSLDLMKGARTQRADNLPTDAGDAMMEGARTQQLELLSLRQDVKSAMKDVKDGMQSLGAQQKALMDLVAASATHIVQLSNKLNGSKQTSLRWPTSVDSVSSVSLGF